MNKWEALKKYCQNKIDQAREISPDFDTPAKSTLRDECAYMMKHYHDVLLQMKKLEGRRT